MNWDYNSTESRLLSSVCERANFYLQRIQKRRVAPLPQEFGVPEELANSPVELGKIVAELDDFGWAGTVAKASWPRPAKPKAAAARPQPTATTQAPVAVSGGS